MNSAERFAMLMIRAIAGLGVMAIVVFAVNIIANSQAYYTHALNYHLVARAAQAREGDIYSADEFALRASVDGQRRYATDARIRLATFHVLGNSNTARSVERSARLSLLGFKNNRYDYLLGAASEYQGYGYDVHLSLSAAVSKAALQALGQYRGLVLISNYQTGRIVANVSLPSFDPADPDPAAWTKAADGAFFDAMTQGSLPVGSVQKIATLIAALRTPGYDVQEQTFTCTGLYQRSDGKVHCTGIHGQQDIHQAFANSCNSAFAEMTYAIGRTRLLATMNDLGFNGHLQLSYLGRPVEASSVFKISPDLMLGLYGAGAANSTMNPLHLSALLAAIANDGGTICQPGLIDYIEPKVGEQNAFWRLVNNPRSRRIYLPPEPVTLSRPLVSQKEAATLREIMGGTVEGTARELQHLPGLTIRCKTGTAENTNSISDSVLAGFFDEIPYSFVILVKNAAGSEHSAVKVANAVFPALADFARAQAEVKD